MDATKNPPPDPIGPRIVHWFRRRREELLTRFVLAAVTGGVGLIYFAIEQHMLS